VYSVFNDVISVTSRRDSHSATDNDSFVYYWCPARNRSNVKPTYPHRTTNPHLPLP